MIGKITCMILLICFLIPFVFLCLKRNSKNVNAKGPEKEDWIFLIIFSTVFFVLIGYTDIYVTARNSCTLLDCIFEGKIQNFYLTESVYTLPTYILYAVWNIPIYIFEKITKVNVLNNNIYYVIFNLWNKLLPYLFALKFTDVTVMLAEDMGLSIENRRWVKYLMLSSPVLIFSQLIFGQYDTFWLVFLIVAIRELYKNNIDKFAIWIGVAASFKVLPFIVALPLLLLVEKKLIKLIKHGVEMCVLPGIFEVIKMLAPKSQLAASFMGNQMKGLFSTGIEHKFGTLSLFLMFYVMICIFLYSFNWKELIQEKKTKMVLYVPILILSVMFALMEWHPQWFLMFVPFVIISMFVNENVVTQTYIDVVMTVFLIIMAVVIGSNSDVNESMIQQGILSLVKGNVTHNRLYDVYTIKGKMNVAMYHSILSALLLSQAWIHFPKRVYMQKESMDEMYRFLLWGRVLCLYVIVVPIIILYFI